MPGTNRIRREAGAAFIVVTILALVATMLIGTYLSASLGRVRHVELQVARTSAFNAAESALNAAIEDAWRLYREQAPSERVAFMEELDGRYDADSRLALSERRIGRSRGSARVVRALASGSGYADVEFVARGTNDRVTRTIRAVVRYGHKPAEVFDHAYFINNFGWLWGAGITVNGSVRSNANFSVANATVNGDIIASENPALGAEGTVEGSSRNKTLDWYRRHYGPEARPTNPTAVPEDLDGDGFLDPGEDRNGNGMLDSFEYVDGYDGVTERKERLPAVDMPYLGDLSIYRALAAETSGTITQGGHTIVGGVLGDDPGEESNLVLVGTEDSPIVVSGVVVIENDLVLKGVITGQGTIYAGRNVHLIGDVTYANPPSWPKPTEDLATVKKANRSADMIGFAAKGSVVFGDYTDQGWRSVTRRYQRPPFTQAYEVDPTDDSIGYVSYWSDGRPMFDGDYTAFDGGQKASDPPPNGHGEPGTEARRYFESSFSDSVIHSLAENQVRHVDGVIYTNHLLTGKVGACTFNGTLVSRDEAIIYHGSLFINYDVRVRYGGYEFLNAYLPREPTHSLILWNEGG